MTSDRPNAWWREHAAHQPAGDRRDRAAENRNAEQHGPARAGHPEGEQHEAAEAVAPDRANHPGRKRPAWSGLVHEPGQQESREREPDRDAEKGQARAKRDDRPEAQRHRDREEGRRKHQPATRTPRAGGFKPGQAVDLHRVSRIASSITDSVEYRRDNTGRPADGRAERGWPDESISAERTPVKAPSRGSFCRDRLVGAWPDGPRVSGTAHGCRSVLSVLSAVDVSRSRPFTGRGSRGSHLSSRDADLADLTFVTGRGSRGSHPCHGTRISRISTLSRDADLADLTDCLRRAERDGLGRGLGIMSTRSHSVVLMIPRPRPNPPPALGRRRKQSTA